MPPIRRIVHRIVATSDKHQLREGEPESCLPPVERNIVTPFQTPTSCSAMVRDPRSLFLYWTVEGDAGGDRIGARGIDIRAVRTWMLRAVDHTDGSVRDIEVQLSWRNYYLHVHPDHVYDIRLGVCDAVGEFHTILRTGAVQMPPADWASPDGTDGGVDWDRLLQIIGQTAPGSSACGVHAS